MKDGVCPPTQEQEEHEDEGPAITNPWHSKPLDVHRWSDHPEAIKLADQLWQEYFPDYANKSRSGPKPKAGYARQLRVVLLDLWVAWKEDPELSIGVPLSANAWNTTSRYNAIHISKGIIPIIHRLREVGLIDFSHGSYGGPYAPYNRNSRIRASEKLVGYFQGCALKPRHVVHHPERECIILKDKDEGDPRAKLIDYQDDETINAMRQVVQDYNRLLSRTFIDIPYLAEPYVERPVTSGPRAGEVDRVSIEPNRTFVRRIFSRDSWSLNGRFYGGWWQQVSSEVRKDIFLDDTPTIEVDFKGMHVAILSHENGVDLEGDPYELPVGAIPSTSPELQRKLVKQLILTCINARDHASAFAAFRDGWPQGHPGKGMTNEDCEALLGQFLLKHPHLEGSMCSDQGIRLMNLDSQIAEKLISAFTGEGIPILSVHDSFIVPYDRTRLLRGLMRHYSRLVVGKELAVDSEAAGLDEFYDRPRDIQLDFITWRQIPRSQGYLQRWEEHEVGLE